MSFFSRKSPAAPAQKPAKGANASMRVTVKQPGPCQQHLTIHLAPEMVAPVRETIVKEFQKGAVLDGFRKGKAPADRVERAYPAQIREETVRRLTRHAFEQVATDRKLKPIGPFEVIKLDFDEAKGLDVEAQVEVEPEFALAEYKGIALKKIPVHILPEELDKALARLQESAAQLVPKGEGEPKEKQLPALDDEFAKDMGLETLPQLRSHIELTLQEHKKTEQAQALEQALCEVLTERHRFEVPPGLVGHQTERLRRDFQTRLLLNGIPEAEVGAHVEKYGEQLKTNAAKLVKLAFILDRIAEHEQLSITQEEVVERLWKLAKQWNRDPVEVRRMLDAKGMWSSVLSSIRQDKTIAWLLNAAKIEEPVGAPVAVASKPPAAGTTQPVQKPTR